MTRELRCLPCIYSFLCSCISHAIHLAAFHFVKALNVPGITAARRNAQNPTKGKPEDESDDEEIAPEDEYDDNFDVDTSMEVDADASNPEDLLSIQMLILILATLLERL